MKISKQARRDAKQLFRSCRVKGLLQESRVRQVVQQVIDQKPRGYLAILSHFHRLVRLEVDLHTARVESAVPLAADLQSGVTGKLGKIYGEGLDISFQQNPGLIGGMRIKVGCDIYDGSIRARLNKLAESF